MGRIKTGLAKRMAKDLLELAPEGLNPNFEDNKRIITPLLTHHNKRIRNSIAGLLCRIKKRQE